jgi:putative FmdB family regulatory protein
MPVYNYRCTNQDCQSEQEFYHGVQEAVHPACPACGYTMNKLVSAVPHKFKQPRGTMGIISNKGGSRGIEREDLDI